MNAPHEAPGGALRQTGVGASEAAAALGLSPYQTPVEIYLRKVGEAAPVADNGPMRMGRLLEPIVLDLYEEQAGPINRQQHTLQALQHPFMFATPDALNLDGAYPVDAKTVGMRSLHLWGEPGTDEVPQEYLVQVTHQMIVLGARQADIAVLKAGQEFAIYRVDYDAELAEMIVEGLRSFWDRVQRREPPPPSSPADVSALYRTSRAEAVEADGARAQAVAELVLVREQIKAFSKREEELVADLKAYLGSRDTLTHEGRTIATWKSGKASQRFHADTFKAAHPELYQQFTTTEPGSRRFLLKGA